MEEQNNVIPQSNPQQENDDFSIKEILAYCWRLKWWMAAGAFIALVLAFCYLRLQTPQYQRTSWIMLNKPDGTNTEMSILAEFTGKVVSKKIDNEVFILKSPTLLSKVVSDLDLNTRYYHYVMPVADRVRFGRSLFAVKKVEYYQDSPLGMSIVTDPLYPEQMHPSSVKVSLRNIDGKQYQIKELRVGKEQIQLPSSTYSYGDSLSVNSFKLVIGTTGMDDLIDGDRYICTWNTPLSTAQAFESHLSATTNGKQTQLTDVITLTYTDALPRRAEDILNALVLKSNFETKAYRSLSTQNTLDFIDQRLSAIASELGNAENEFKDFQSSRVLVDMNSQSQMAVSSDMQYRNQLTEVRVQSEILKMVSDLITQSPQGQYTVIPANIGISDGGLNTIIANYNSLVAERNRMVANSSETNPRVLSLNSQLDDAKQSIIMSVASLQRVYALRDNELSRVINASQKKMAEMPKDQVELAQLSRKVDIIEPLYLLLQQKREEAQIAFCSETDNFRVIEPAFGSPVPVSPNRKMIYLLALICGLAFPVLFVMVRKLLRFRVETKKDIEERLDKPVLAIIPKHKESGYSLIPNYGRDEVSESFRMLRSNIQYLPDARVIQVTSSVPGEGKSFVASNLALSIAHTGKKVVLVGMDIRKPTLHQVFPEVHQNPNFSVVGYLIGKTRNVEDLVQKSGVNENLDIIVAGSVPPNPSELLSQGLHK
ncbi:MAG: GumC family protein [Candidatus Cryptobacteroides sp.]